MGTQQPKKKTTLVVEEGGLEFVTTEGRVLATLYPETDGVSLDLVGPDGATRLFLSVGLSHASVKVFSAQSGASARLWAGQDRAVCQLTNPEGINTLTLAGGGSENGNGVLSLSSAQGHLAAVMTAVTENGADGGGVSLFNLGAGFPAVNMTARRDGGALSTWTRDGVPAAMLGADGGEGLLSIRKQGGEPIFTIPVHRMPGMAKPGRPSAEEATPEGEPEGAPRDGAV